MQAQRKSRGFDPLTITFVLCTLIVTALAFTPDAFGGVPVAAVSSTLDHPADRCAGCHVHCLCSHNSPRPSLVQQHPPQAERSLHMSIADLMARNALLLINPQHGHTLAMTYNPPGAGEPVPFNGPFDESDANGERQKDARGERTMRQALVDTPVSLGVSEKGTFTALGKNWKILGLVGRDDNLETWRVQLPDHQRVRKPQSNL